MTGTWRYRVGKVKDLVVFNKIVLDENKVLLQKSSKAVSIRGNVVGEIEEIRCRKNNNGDYQYKLIFTHWTAVNCKVGLLDNLDANREFLILTGKLQ